MKALLIVTVIAVTLGSLAARDQDREKRSLSSESRERWLRFNGNRYWYPYGPYPPYPPYQPFGYPRWPWYYFIPFPGQAAAVAATPLPNKK